MLYVVFSVISATAIYAMHQHLGQLSSPIVQETHQEMR